MSTVEEFYDFANEEALFQCLLLERQWSKGTFVVIKDNQLLYEGDSEDDALCYVMSVTSPCLLKEVGATTPVV